MRVTSIYLLVKAHKKYYLSNDILHIHTKAIPMAKPHTNSGEINESTHYKTCFRKDAAARYFARNRPCFVRLRQNSLPRWSLCHGYGQKGFGPLSRPPRIGKQTIIREAEKDLGKPKHN